MGFCKGQNIYLSLTHTHTFTLFLVFLSNGVSSAYRRSLAVCDKPRSVVFVKTKRSSFVGSLVCRWDVRHLRTHLYYSTNIYTHTLNVLWQAKHLMILNGPTGILRRVKECWWILWDSLCSSELTSQHAHFIGGQPADYVCIRLMFCKRDHAVIK